MSGQRRARKAAQSAADDARREAEGLRQQTAIINRRAELAALKAQRVLFRALRARGGGFFETDRADTLGGTGTLG